MSDTYAIVAVHRYYNNPNRFRFDTTIDQRELIAYTVAEAVAEVARRDGGIYVTEHDEIGRPELLIVEIRDAEYIQSGRNGDGGNYDWDGCECTADNGNPCGNCDACYSHIFRQDLEWLREVEFKIEHFDLYDSDNTALLTAEELGITADEYAKAILESLSTDTPEGHIRIGERRVYAAD